MRSKLDSALVVGLATLCILASAAVAQAAAGWDECFVTKVDSPADWDDFGRSVAASGEFFIAGAPALDDEGAAYIFRKEADAWSLHTELISPGGSGNSDWFGRGVAIDGNIAAVSDPHDESEFWKAGTVWVYRYNEVEDLWEFEQAVRPEEDGHEDQLFGYSVALHNEVLVVGARNDREQARQAGAVYVFSFDGDSWKQDVKLTASDPEENGLLGCAVDIVEDVIVAGALGQDDAYVFRRSDTEWVEEDKVSGPPNDSRFGYSVATNGERVVIGSTQEVSQNGAAYVYHYQGMQWSLEQRLTAANPEGPWPFMGRSVDIADEGDLIIVGATGDAAGRGQGNSDVGALHVFRLEPGDGWVESAKLSTDDTIPGLCMGVSATLHGEYAITGASGNSGGPPPPPPPTGAVYVFRVDGRDVNDNGVPDECECLADLDGSGSVDFADVLAVLAAWDNAGGAEDLDGNGTVGFDDLLIVLAEWGQCP